MSVIKFKDEPVPWYIRVATFFKSFSYAYDTESSGLSNSNTAQYLEYKTLFGKMYVFRSSRINLDYFR